MVIDVDLSTGAVDLREPEDTKSFHVEAKGDGDLDAALQDADVGRMSGDDALIDLAAIRRMAAGRVGDAWETDFEAMVAYAGQKGWLHFDAIQGHVERTE
jgi:hypothetical protein